MEIDIRQCKVMLGMPLKDMTPKQTVMSIAKTMREAGRIGLDLRYAQGSASNNDRARDIVVDGFLSSDCDKLFWVDSDMVWEPEAFFKLIALSTQVDIVLASYPAKVEGPIPFFVDMDSPAETGDFGLLKIKGAGLGFCCMDRKPVQAIADISEECYDQSIERNRKKIFRHDIFEGKDRTEDFAFFADAMDCGFDIWLDPTIELGHIGSKEWRGKLADAHNIQLVKEDNDDRSAERTGTG